MLWEMFPDHPNLLLPILQMAKPSQNSKNTLLRPLFSREGANIRIIENGKEIAAAGGPYGERRYDYSVPSTSTI